VDFESKFDGIASGRVVAQGEGSIDAKQVRLNVALENVNFNSSAGIPISKLSGMLSIEGDVVRISQMQFFLRDIPCELTGEIHNAFSGKPEVQTSLRIGEAKQAARLNLAFDLARETVGGDFQLFDFKYSLNGSLKKIMRGIFLSDFMVNGQYQAHARFNVRKGLFDIKIERGTERFQTSFSIKKFSGALDFQLEHFNLFGFDVVTAGRFKFQPNDAAWKTKNRYFDATLETDYLVFQHQLLRDFKAETQASLQGLHGILARWGGLAELRGNIVVERGVSADLTLRTGSIALKNVRTFGIHPLPRSLRGVLEGKLEIKGDLTRPQIDGALSISDGVAGEFEYDQAMVNFSGRLPYLSLHDSKVFIGKNTFILKGALDFKLRNFLEGVEIDNFEHVMIWKGLTLTNEIQNLPGPDYSADVSAGKILSEYGSGSVRGGADYKINKRTSLHVAAGTDEGKEDYVTVGPKLKF
jgi:hypothetical protein